MCETPPLTASTKRQYLKHRAEQEVWMTLHADSIEAEGAHNELTGLYLKACIQCMEGESQECMECPLRPICERDIKPELRTSRERVSFR